MKFKSKFKCESEDEDPGIKFSFDVDYDGDIVVKFDNMKVGVFCTKDGGAFMRSHLFPMHALHLKRRGVALERLPLRDCRCLGIGIIE